jgi:hypothetical protein
MSAAFEVHEHIFISGPRANGVFIQATQKTTSHCSHSHAGGSAPHKHPDTGPASYTIDKDDWSRATGMLGGGRKKFTKQPTGEQLPIADLEDWQKSFEIVVCPPPKEFRGTGAGMAAAIRMILGFGMTVAAVRDGRKP